MSALLFKCLRQPGLGQAQTAIYNAIQDSNMVAGTQVLGSSPAASQAGTRNREARPCSRTLTAEVGVASSVLTANSHLISPFGNPSGMSERSFPTNTAEKAQRKSTVEKHATPQSQSSSPFSFFLFLFQD